MTGTPNGKFWVQVAGGEVSVESLLLEALKTVANSDMCRRIEEALVARQRGRCLEEKEAEEAEERSG